jgi:hypothetical protein
VAGRVEIKKLNKTFALLSLCGELGIRTPGGFHLNSFQDCRNRPLCQLSGAKIHSQIIPPKFLAKRKKKGG